MPRDLPSPELLRKLLRYEPETGKLFWRHRPREMFSSANSFGCWNTRYAGREAFTANSAGYLRGAIFDRLYKAHRVAWALHYGEWPKATIDHINGVKKDNRILNLRDVSHGQNCRNKPVGRGSATGCNGVYVAPSGNWFAKITFRRKSIHLGTFGCFTAAMMARKLADKKYGFHENHGRVA